LKWFKKHWFRNPFKRSNLKREDFPDDDHVFLTDMDDLTFSNEPPRRVEQVNEKNRIKYTKEISQFNEKDNRDAANRLSIYIDPREAWRAIRLVELLKIYLDNYYCLYLKNLKKVPRHVLKKYKRNIVSIFTIVVNELRKHEKVFKTVIDELNEIIFYTPNATELSKFKEQDVCTDENLNTLSLYPN
jgi:hypothetical protein